MRRRMSAWSPTYLPCIVINIETVAVRKISKRSKSHNTHRKGRDGIGVRNRLEVLIQVVHERYTGGDVQASNHLLGDAVEVLHQRAQRVSC